MKNLLFISILVSIVLTQQTTSYSWEDGTGTILGSYGNLSDPANVGTTSGVSPYDGNRMLTVSESPLSSTPQAFIAWVTDISEGDEITACFYGYDNTPSSSPSLRIWGSWSANDDIDSYGGSADGNTDYTDGSGWGQVCHTFTTDVIVNGQMTWDSGEALIIQARLYSSSGGPDPTVYFIDLVEITAPNSVTVNYPGGATDGCTDPNACNYNAFATDDDGSCVYPTDMSIYDIQYTANQGDYCYESDYAGTCVRTTGTVTAESPLYPNFYIQDETSSTYSGIYVHNYSASPPTLGQNITITAMVNEYYSLTQLIDGVSYTVNSSGNSITPTDISTGSLTGCTDDGESVESMLVRINNVVVTTPSNEYGEWYVDDGSGPCKIDNKIFDGEWLAPSSSQEFASITGMVDYAYSEFSIFPRTMSDIVLCSTCPVADAGDNQTVESNTLVSLDGSNSYDPDGTIIAYEWTQLSGIPVVLTDEEAAFTEFTAPATVGDLVFKLTVYDNEFNEASDEVTITVGTCTFISDIQFTTVQGTYCYETEMSGEVNLCPVIVTHIVPQINAGSAGNFFVTQPGLQSWGGIFIRDFDILPDVGDEIDLTATVNEYYSMTQLIDVTSSFVVSSGNSVIPLSINTGDLGIDCSFEGESYEGMLVRVNNITVEDIDEFGNIKINDGSGSTLMDDYYFDGTFPTISIGDNISSIIGNVGYSYNEFKIYPRSNDDLGSCVDMGDLNSDGAFNVLDVVSLANCVLANNCSELENGCAADMNGDGAYNVLDIVALVNCVLANNCGGRVDDASHSKLIIDDNMVSIEADGFIGGVQMTLEHNDDFTIDMTDRALFADYLTNSNETRLLVINPETEDLFSYIGDFEISEIIVANTQYEVSVDLPITSDISLSEAYPNPFNPKTTMTLTMPMSGTMQVEVYNLLGQVVSTLASGYMDAGTYKLTWDASEVSSGMYFVKAQTDGFTKTQKLMLIK